MNANMACKVSASFIIDGLPINGLQSFLGGAGRFNVSRFILYPSRLRPLPRNQDEA